MGALESIGLIALLLVVATLAAAGGYVASSVARRNKRRDRGVFREIRPGERLGDFERWDLLMPEPFGASSGA